MIKVNQISLRLKEARTIIENLSFVLNAGDKLAIIGEEGNGKSTLLKFLYDARLVENYCNGAGTTNIIKKQCGYLPQMMDSCYEDMGSEEYFLYDDAVNEFNYEIYHELYKIEKLFHEFTLDLDILSENRPLRLLSGGEKIKIQLIKIIFKQPDLLLLDEPTNDLDLATLQWLEHFLLNTKIPIIFVSHDETLLTKVSNMILHIELLKKKTISQFTFERLNYGEYVDLRRRRLAQQSLDAHRTQKVKEEKRQILLNQHLLVENDLDRAVRNPTQGRLLAKKMASIKAQEKKLDTMEVVENPHTEESINIFFAQDIYIHKQKIILDFHLPYLRAADNILSKHIDLFIKGPKHMTIIGPNGSGKSTLLKAIVEELTKRKDLNFGYMPQDYDTMLDLSSSPLAYLQVSLGYDEKVKAQIMTCLGALRFLASEMLGPIGRLSGGQKAKLFLLKLIMNKNDVLVLDEPTRNLSPLSSPIIREILASFPGAIIAVSHDRLFIEEVSKVIYELDEDGLHAVQNIKDLD